MSRRQLLGGSVAGFAALSFPPVELFLDLIVRDVITKAHATGDVAMGSRNYVNLLLPGAPHRYVFDHWMKTRPADAAMISNPMVSTALLTANGVPVDTQYLTFDYRGVLVPHMFSHNVLNGAGQQRPLRELLDNMMVIRGYGTGMDGHPTNATVQLAPVGGVSSLSGLAADYSQKTFQAIQWPNRTIYGKFVSQTGKAINQLDGNNPLLALLAGFATPKATSPQAKARDLKTRNQDAVDLAQSRLLAYANSNHPGAKVVGENMSNASALMKKGVGDLEGYWSEAVTRYTNLIQNSMRMIGLSGISDVPLVAVENPKWKIQVFDHPSSVYHQGDMRAMIQQMEIPYQLAQGFALAEYALQQNYATSIEIWSDRPGVIPLKFEGFDRRATLANDMHDLGAIAGLPLMTASYRGIAAGILELKDRLKAVQTPTGDLWSETVFQISSDFGRSARSNGSGSDHGFNQMVTSVFSGIIKEPTVIGNILRTGHDANYDGTQGIGAPIEGYNQAGRPTPTMAASTVAALLRVPHNPFQNLAAPLVDVQGDRVVPRIVGKMVG